MIEAVFVLNAQRRPELAADLNGGFNTFVCTNREGQEAVLLLFRKPPDQFALLGDWLRGALNTTPNGAELSEKLLVWLHKSDFETWGRSFEDMKARALPRNLPKNAVVLRTNRVRLPIGGEPLDMVGLLDDVQNKLAHRVFPQIAALRQLGQGRPAGVPPLGHRWRMKLSYWRHELFRSVGLLRWDLELGTDMANDRLKQFKGGTVQAIVDVQNLIDGEVRAASESDLSDGRDALFDALIKGLQNLHKVTSELDPDNVMSKKAVTEAIKRVDESLVVLAAKVSE